MSAESGSRAERTVIADLKSSRDVRCIEGAGRAAFHERIEMHARRTFELLFLTLFEIIVRLFELLNEKRSGTEYYPGPKKYLGPL